MDETPTKVSLRKDSFCEDLTENIHEENSDGASTSKEKNCDNKKALKNVAETEVINASAQVVSDIEKQTIVDTTCQNENKFTDVLNIDSSFEDAEDEVLFEDSISSVGNGNKLESKLVSQTIDIFSDIESSDNSQAYESETKLKENANALKVSSSTKETPIQDEKIELSLEPVSDEDCFGESSQDQKVDDEKTDEIVEKREGRRSSTPLFDEEDSQVNEQDEIIDKPSEPVEICEKESKKSEQNSSVNLENLIPDSVSSENIVDDIDCDAEEDFIHMLLDRTYKNTSANKMTESDEKLEYKTTNPEKPMIEKPYLEEVVTDENLIDMLIDDIEVKSSECSNENVSTLEQTETTQTPEHKTTANPEEIKSEDSEKEISEHKSIEDSEKLIVAEGQRLDGVVEDKHGNTDQIFMDIPLSDEEEELLKPSNESVPTTEISEQNEKGISSEREQETDKEDDKILSEELIEKETAQDTLPNLETSEKAEGISEFVEREQVEIEYPQTQQTDEDSETSKQNTESKSKTSDLIEAMDLDIDLLSDTLQTTSADLDMEKLTKQETESLETINNVEHSQSEGILENDKDRPLEEVENPEPVDKVSITVEIIEEPKPNIENETETLVPATEIAKNATETKESVQIHQETPMVQESTINEVGPTNTEVNKTVESLGENQEEPAEKDVLETLKSPVKQLESIETIEINEELTKNQESAEESPNKSIKEAGQTPTDQETKETGKNLIDDMQVEISEPSNENVCTLDETDENEEKTESSEDKTIASLEESKSEDLNTVSIEKSEKVEDAKIENFENKDETKNEEPKKIEEANIEVFKKKEDSEKTENAKMDIFKEKEETKIKESEKTDDAKMEETNNEESYNKEDAKNKEASTSNVTHQTDNLVHEKSPDSDKNVELKSVTDKKASTDDKGEDENKNDKIFKEPSEPSTVDPDVIEIDDDDDDIPIVTKNKSNVSTQLKEPNLAQEIDNKDQSKSAVESLENNDKKEPSIEKLEVTKTSKNKPVEDDTTMKSDDNRRSNVAEEDEEPLLMIDPSHKEDNEDNYMDTETEQTATSAPSTDSSSDVSLDVFYNKECLNYECKHACKNFFRATLFTLNFYKITKKRNKTQFVCEDCYDKALGAYEEMCKTLQLKQPLLLGTTFKSKEFVEIIDSSDEDESDTNTDKTKDENTLPKETIKMLEAEFSDVLRKVLNKVEIQNQCSWTKQILQQRLQTVEDDTAFISEQLRTLQKKADNMHNSLYQCPKIKIRQLTPLDLNSGKTYNPESETSIPPMGEVLRPIITVHETYYAVKNKAIASWVPCKVVEIIESAQSKQLRTYKIKFLKSKYPMTKNLSGKHMAYFNAPKVRLPIGTRVIAYFDASTLSRGKEKMNIPSAFYPGIIAEPLKQSNKFRYLVFYDDGYFQYVYHTDVRLVCQVSENVWEDVHHQSREFIHNYLTQYAFNRPMVHTSKGQSMLVDYNGKWIYARVIDVDCSLVQMLFEGQSRSEWIYRGSTRLGPVFKEFNNVAQKSSLNTSRVLRRTEPFVRYLNNDDSTASQQAQESSESTTTVKAGEPRSVAKKSVSRTDSSSNASTSTTPAATPLPTVRHLNNSTIFVDDDNKPKGKVVYYTARKNLPPRNYVPHICNPSCPFNVTHNLSFYSPLAKPLLSGWERQMFRQKNKKFVVYRGPCGKRMRNMEELHRYLRVTENELNVDNFDFSPDTNCLAEYVLESCIVQKKDISNGREKMPIPCVNYYDDTMPPDCIYSSRRIPTEGVHLNLDREFLVGCDCEDDCSDKSKCSCWELTYAGAKYGMPTVPTEMVGYQYKRLYEHVPTGIYECNSRCKCKANCVNRVVQQPLQSKLQVFKTSNRGWGLRCINDVPRGSFICVYAGHLLTEQHANEGGLDAGDEYFAELDYIEVAEQIKEGYESDAFEPEEDEDLYNPEQNDDDDEFVAPTESSSKAFNTRLRARRTTKSTDAEHDSQERQTISFEPNKTMDTSNPTNEKPSIRKLFGKDEACYVMDAKVTGNLGRYFNHSCNPNLFVQNVFVDTHDLRFPWVAFFALSHIRAGTELTWNYNYEVGVVPGKVLYCQCGAPNCRQRLL